MRFTKVLCLVAVAMAARADIVVPEGTRVRLRLEQDVYKIPESEGSAIALSVAEPVEMEGRAAISMGAQAHGFLAAGKRKDLVVDRVQLSDGSWVGLRTRRKADGLEEQRGLLAAGIRTVDGSAGVLKEGSVFDLYTQPMSKTVALPVLTVIGRSSDEVARVAGYLVESGQETSTKLFRDGYFILAMGGLGLVVIGGAYRLFGGR